MHLHAIRIYAVARAAHFGWGLGVGGGETDGTSGFVSNILFTCGLGQRNRCNDLLRPGDPEDRIQVRARYLYPVKTGRLAHPTSYTRAQDHSRGYSNRYVALTTYLYVALRLKEE